MATIKSSGDILSSIATDLADNNAGLISAEDVRHNMEDTVASVNRIVCSGDLDNQYPLYNVVRISNKLADGESASATKTHGDIVIESGIFFPNGPANATKRQTEPWLGEGGINHNNIGNLTAGDPHTQYYALNGARNLTANFKAGNHWVNASGFDNIGFKFIPVGNTDNTATQGTDQEIYTSGTFRFSDGSSIANGKGHAKAFVRFDGNNGQTDVDIYAHHNISGVGKVAAGKYEIHFNSGVFANAKHIIAVATANGTTASGSLEDMDVNTATCVLRGPIGGNDHRQLATLAVQDEASQYVDAKLVDVVFFGLEPNEASGDAPATFAAGTDYFGG